MRLLRDVLRSGAVSLAVLAACFHMEFVRAEGGQQTSRPVIQEIVVTGAKGLHCPIRFRDPYVGRITDDSYALDITPYPRNGLAQLFLTFECVSSDDTNRIRNIVSARYNQREEHWEEDYSAISADEIPLVKPVTRSFLFQTANSQGIGITRDAINGEPRMRDRGFAFCLRHPPVVLCGYTPQIARPYYKHSDLLPFAMTIVKSIEFIDESPSIGADHSKTAICAASKC